MRFQDHISIEFFASFQPCVEGLPADTLLACHLGNSSSVFDGIDGVPTAFGPSGFT